VLAIGDASASVIDVRDGRVVRVLSDAVPCTWAGGRNDHRFIDMLRTPQRARALVDLETAKSIALSDVSDASSIEVTRDRTFFAIRDDGGIDQLDLDGQLIRRLYERPK
jgi:hypothetical protein